MSLSPHESQHSMRRLTAGVLSLSGFLVAILSGLHAGNPTGSVIVTAMVCMVVCHIAGSLLGLVLENVLTEHRRTLTIDEMHESPVETGIEVGEFIESDQASDTDQTDPVKAAA